MAKRTSTAIVRASTVPTIRLAIPRTAPLARVPRSKGGHRRRAAVGSVGGVTPIKAAVTAAVIGTLEKSGTLDALPEVPYIGRKGLITLVAWYWARHGGGQIARDVCLVGAALCGYQFGKEQSVTG